MQSVEKFNNAKIIELTISKKKTIPELWSEINSTAKLFCLLLPKFISDSYFVDKNVDKISQFRLGGNSQKSQQKP